MARGRRVIFWCHLTAGVTCGLVILVMCVTGALLAFQPQILSLLERHVRRVQPSRPRAERIPVSAMLDAAVHASDQPPTGFSLESDEHAAASVTFGRDAIVYVDPYTGKVLGTGASTARSLFQRLTDWHRWLGAEGPLRDAARWITDASNLVFLGLAVSGLYLWLPRNWSRRYLRSVALFDARARGKARDFNWHNVIGLWCAPVLIVLTSTAVVMSYPWANNLLYRMTGSESPASGGAVRGQGQGARANRPRQAGGDLPASTVPMNIDLLWDCAERALPSWGSISMRLVGRPGATVSFTLTDATYWNEHARSQLALDAKTGDVVRWEPYVQNSLGQKARGWARFGHTGELGGWPGQLVAGLASAGGALLVWTGLSLAIRRLAGFVTDRHPIRRGVSVARRRSGSSTLDTDSG